MSNRGETGKTEYVSVEISSNNLADSMMDKLRHELPLPHLSEKCIWQVPKRLRSCNKKAFDPKIISIGPYHHGKPELEPMEKIKSWYLKSLLHRLPGGPEETLAEFVKNIRELRSCAQQCYADRNESELDDDKFVEMLILDGCFLVELFRKDAWLIGRHEDDRIFSTPWMLQNLYHDLILLENQIPWVVLLRLFQLSELAVTRSPQEATNDVLAKVSPQEADDTCTSVCPFLIKKKRKGDNDVQAKPCPQEKDNDILAKPSPQEKGNDVLAKPSPQEKDNDVLAKVSPQEADNACFSVCSFMIKKKRKGDNDVQAKPSPQEKDNDILAKPSPQEKDNDVPNKPSPQEKDNDVPNKPSPQEKDNDVPNKPSPQEKDNDVLAKPSPQEKDNNDVPDKPSPQGKDNDALAKLVLKFFETMMLLTEPAQYKNKYQIKHVLSLLYSCLLSSSATTIARNDLHWKLVPAVTELLLSGVKFKKGSPGNILNIKFSNGVFEIPPIRVRRNSESMFQNLIAYEECNQLTGHHFTSYAVLLDYLINTSADAESLCDEGIIVDALSTEDIALVFNRLHNETLTSQFHFGELTKDINQYYRARWHRWRNSLMSKHFKNPWSILSVVAAILVLAFTFTQTLCSILSCKLPFPK